jgi:hypothetical protein
VQGDCQDEPKSIAVDNPSEGSHRWRNGWQRH